MFHIVKGLNLNIFQLISKMDNSTLNEVNKNIRKMERSFLLVSQLLVVDTSQSKANRLTEMDEDVSRR